MEALRYPIELAAQAIELFAVAVIVLAIVHATTRFLLQLQREQKDAYEGYKRYLGKSLLLALEFLVAADIVRTVALEPTLANVQILGMLVKETLWVVLPALAVGIGAAALVSRLTSGLLFDVPALDVPTFALVYGAVFLDEAVRAVSIAGLALVLAWVALGTGTVRR